MELNLIATPTRFAIGGFHACIHHPFQSFVVHA
ncbi:hypothetical protein FHX15_002451 [Rhizobium sp. BK650]|nr:hypothetical protein [Rhizobium sp. BK650]